jgi:hypothetical protein
MNLRNFHFQLTAGKLFFMAGVLLLTSTITIAQTNIAIAPIKLNVLYVGVDNPISVAASGGTDDKVTVSISGGGTITKVGTGLYNIHVSEPTNDCVVSVYVDGKLAGTSSFRVRNLPAPVGTVGGFKSGENISFTAFSSLTGVGVYVKDFPFDIQYEVLGFTFSVDDNKGDVKSADCQGAYFSSVAKDYIGQYVKAGRTVTIDKIRVKDQSGKEWKIPALVYFVK